ncbi:Non-toxic nonhemagglutinin type C [Dissostichus eleginoides]|uniref:Non-toxic nonhemagglutinin type C n=1 Tax=Dissostichus eleginoides TaxID=100907 RepID=A0AAD9ET99_DISEL|nr:Non-toxic nonhemagglutinin type C [Dissostichus eleginoides]
MEKEESHTSYNWLLLSQRVPYMTDDFMLSHAVTAGMPSFPGAFKLPQDDHRQHRPTLTDNFPLAIITSQSQENCPSKQSISSASEGSAVQH